MSLRLLYTISCIKVFTLIAAGNFIQFKLLTDPYLMFVPLGVELAEFDVITCARQCLLRDTTCFSFVYNRLLNTCSLGSWTAITPVAVTHVNTYTRTLPCNITANFTLQQSGDVRVCVKVSNNSLTYAAAKDVCTAFGGNLFTIKTTEKLSIMKSVGFGNEVWVGLDDLVTEDVFRWVDDGTVLLNPWRSFMFASGEPYGGRAENCVGVSGSTFKLNDIACSYSMPYMCEMPVLKY